MLLGPRVNRQYGGIDLQTILVLLNTVLVLVALGTMVYTRLLFERPVIVEEEEIKKVEEEIKKPAPTEADRVIVKFDEMMINLEATNGHPHYAKVAFAIECRDAESGNIATYKKAELADAVIKALGHRQMSELNSIQGKLMLKTELLREFNKLVPGGGILDFYWSDFSLQ